MMCFDTISPHVCDFLCDQMILPHSCDYNHRTPFITYFSYILFRSNYSFLSGSYILTKNILARRAMYRDKVGLDDTGLTLIPWSHLEIAVDSKQRGTCLFVRDDVIGCVSISPHRNVLLVR